MKRFRDRPFDWLVQSPWSALLMAGVFALLSVQSLFTGRGNPVIWGGCTLIWCVIGWVRMRWRVWP